MTWRRGTGPVWCRMRRRGHDDVVRVSGGGGAARTLGWDVEGQLATVSGAASGSFVYDANGSRLIRWDGGGTGSPGGGPGRG